MSGFRFHAWLLFASAALAGCATVTTGTSQKIEVLVEGGQASRCTLQKPGYGPVTVMPGKQIFIPRGSAPLTALCESQGLDTASVLVQAYVQDRAKFEMPLGMLIDYLSGARYEYPAQVTVTFAPALASLGGSPASVRSTPSAAGP